MSRKQTKRNCLTFSDLHHHHHHDRTKTKRISYLKITQLPAAADESSFLSTIPYIYLFSSTTTKHTFPNKSLYIWLFITTAVFEPYSINEQGQLVIQALIRKNRRTKMLTILLVREAEKQPLPLSLCNKKKLFYSFLTHSRSFFQ